MKSSFVEGDDARLFSDDIAKATQSVGSYGPDPGHSDRAEAAFRDVLSPACHDFVLPPVDCPEVRIGLDVPPRLGAHTVRPATLEEIAAEPDPSVRALAIMSNDYRADTPGLPAVLDGLGDGAGWWGIVARHHSTQPPPESPQPRPKGLKRPVFPRLNFPSLFDEAVLATADAQARAEQKEQHDA